MQKTIAGLGILLFTTFVSYAGADASRTERDGPRHLRSAAALHSAGSLYDRSVTTSGKRSSR